MGQQRTTHNQSIPTNQENNDYNDHQGLQVHEQDYAYQSNDPSANTQNTHYQGQSQDQGTKRNRQDQEEEDVFKAPTAQGQKRRKNEIAPIPSESDIEVEGDREDDIPQFDAFAEVSSPHRTPVGKS